MLVALLVLALQSKEKPIRLPPVDLKQPVIWGASAEGDGGFALSFGGQDQGGTDGASRTRVRVDGTWTAIHDELRTKHPLQPLHARTWALRERLKARLARSRHEHFEGRPLPADPAWSVDAAALLAALPESETDAKRRLGEAMAREAAGSLRDLDAARIALEQAAETLDAEPPPRALSPLAWVPASKRFVLFGGDHLDYLLNDTWLFDPASRTWSRVRPSSAPPPRAHHALRVAEGRVILSGGYTYTSSTDYVGGQYRNLADGEWVFDVSAGAWSGGAGVEPGTRTYRTGRLHPDHVLDAPPADREAVAKRLAELPVNTWVAMDPPQRPALNRDWGTAVIDPDRDLILRWSGGHSAHGGTDVLHYHLATNRWDLPHAVEFPLGQLYVNTEYPEGLNFNLRPWVTGHTYQSYGVDPVLKKMLFVGRRADVHVYDPDLADWSARFEKPKALTYGDAYYTLTLTPTPQGLVCWTKDGKLFRFEEGAWVEKALSGKLPGSVVDNSTLWLDAKRNRLCFVRKPYGDSTRFDGRIHAVDLASWTVSELSPGGREGAAAIPYLCQLRYDPVHDLVLVGGTLPPGEDGPRRTPAYDPAGDRWISLRIGGEDPNGPKGRNVSLGLVHDAKRGLFWAVDTNSRVFVLRPKPAEADPRPL